MGGKFCLLFLICLYRHLSVYPKCKLASEVMGERAKPWKDIKSLQKIKSTSFQPLYKCINVGVISTSPKQNSQSYCASSVTKQKTKSHAATATFFERINRRRTCSKVHPKCYQADKNRMQHLPPSLIG